MATAVGVMDAPGFTANTDVLVVVDPVGERLAWVPRDLWCDGIRDRVNQAFALGGHEGLTSALAEHGFEIEHSVCVARAAAERALSGVRVDVPVTHRDEFWYPLEPTRPIEEGRKRIVFEPPSETLSGERIHQWIGARYKVEGPGSDIERLGRQQTVLRVLLEGGYDLSPALEVRDEISLSDPAALEDLRRIRPGWALSTFGVDATPREIDGKLVLVR
jgi:anionic cell wall polymer biosynthesis LytR-Cps2A-Psr (LCP) family protein